MRFPAVPPPPAESTLMAPIDLLSAIEKTHGLTDKQDAIAAMTRLYGTTVVTRLSADDHAELVEILRFRLANPAHEHAPDDFAYTPTGFGICKRCGGEMPEEAQQPALT